MTGRQQPKRHVRRVCADLGGCCGGGAVLEETPSEDVVVGASSAGGLDPSDVAEEEIMEMDSHQQVSVLV